MHASNEISPSAVEERVFCSTGSRHGGGEEPECWSTFPISPSLEAIITVKKNIMKTPMSSLLLDFMINQFNTVIKPHITTLSQNPIGLKIK